MKHQLPSWTTVQKKKDFESKTVTNYNTEHYHLLCLIIARGVSRRLQSASPTASMRASLLANVIVPFSYTIDWLPRIIFQPVPASENRVKLGICCVNLYNLCPNPINRFWINISPKDWTLEPNNSGLTSGLSRQSVGPILPGQRRERSLITVESEKN